MQVITKEQRKAMKRLYDRRPVFKGGDAAQLARNAGWTFVAVADMPENVREKLVNKELTYAWVHDRYRPIYEDASNIVEDYALSTRLTYRQFRKTAAHGFDCLMIAWAGMWIGIEKDGYTHS